MLDDVKGKVVEAAEAPDRDSQQNGDLEMRILVEKQNGGEDPDEEEEEALELNPGGVGEVLHRSELKTLNLELRTLNFEL